MKNTYFKVIVVSILFLLFIKQSNAQTKGLIFDPASTGVGQTVFDPNNDGYISASTSGFNNGIGGDVDDPYNDLPEFEDASQWHKFPTIGLGETLSDIRSGPTEGFTDFSVDPDGYATYMRFITVGPTKYMLFRFRLADFKPNAKGYTVLIDADGLIGNADVGTYKDGENPGFEFAILLRSKHEVSLIDLEGVVSGCGTTIHTYDLDEYHQKAISGVYDGVGDLDVFYDFAIPFYDIADLPWVTGGNLEVDAMNLRFAATTNTSNSCTFQGSVSDIGGQDDNDNPCMSCALEEIIDAQCEQTASNIEGSDFCTACPSISTFEVQEGSNFTIDGIATPGATVTIYLDSGSGPVAMIPSATADAVTGAYTVIVATAILAGDFITARAQFGTQLESADNCNGLTVVASCSGPSPSLLVNGPNGASSQIDGTTDVGYGVFPNGLEMEIRLYGSSTLETGALDAYDNATGVWGYTLDAVDGNNKTEPESYELRLREANGCWSDWVIMCGQSNAPEGEIPNVTSGSPINSGTGITISGEVDIENNNNADGAKISIFQGSNLLGSQTVIGIKNQTISWSVSGLTIEACKSVDVRAQTTRETPQIVTGCFSAPSVIAVTTNQSDAPTINGPYCEIITSVSGTSTEEAGSTVVIYANGVEQGTTQVTSGGSWYLSGLSLGSANSPITATVENTNECETVSSSGSTTISARTAVGSLAITNPVVEDHTTIGITGITGSSINLYIDGFLIASKATASGTETITIPTDLIDPADPITYGIYPGGTLTATQSGGTCESVESASVIVDCLVPAAPKTLSSDLSACSIIEIDELTITESEAGIVYTAYEGPTFTNPIGYSRIGDGNDLILYVGPFTTTGTVQVKVFGTKFLGSGPTCVSEIGFVTYTVYEQPDVSNFATAIAAPICGGSSATVNISSTSLQDATYTVTYDLSAPNASIGNTVSMTFSGDLGSFTTLALPNAGPTTVTITELTNQTGGCSIYPSSGNTANVTVNTCDADLQIVKSVDNASPYVGETIVFTLDVTNNGPSDATNVVVTDNLPTGYTYVLDDGAGAYAGGVWTIGNILNGASAQLNITVSVNATGVYANTATVSGNENDPDGTDDSDTNTPTVNNLPTVTLSASPLTILENGGTSILTATLDAVTFEDVIVNLGYTGTATNATDYGVATFITITAGNLTGTTVITATDDAVYEGNETVITDISSVSGGNASESGTQQVTVTIDDDLDLPTVTLSASPLTILENGGTSTLTATLSNITFEDVIVNLGYTGTAINATDYGVATFITITAGNLTGTTVITATDDAVYEGNETVIADISSVSGGSATENGIQQVTVTITDDEAAPSVTLSSAPATIIENGGVSTLTATLSVATFEDVTVNLTYSGTATNAADYGVANSITILAGNLTGTTDITGIDDVISEGDETVIADISSVSGGSATEDGTQQETVTITDDDGVLVTLSASPLTILENGGTSTLTATLDAVTFEDVIVNLGYTGTATNATDYGVATLITITAGSLTGTTVITATNDAVYEGNETVITDITSVTGGGASESGTQQATVTIDDDLDLPTVTLSASPITILENGGTSTLTATLSNITFENVTVNLGYTGTATNTTDYGVANSITILAGNLTGTTDITGIDDVISEGDETVIADISSVSGGSATEDGTQQETVTITDDEGVLVSLSASPLTILENGGTSILTATLDAVTFEDVIVNLGYTGTATNATDYGVATFITITAGSLTGTTVITATDDAVYEGNETVITDITSVSGGNASESGTQQVTVTIDDDLDLPTVTLSASPLTILENGGTSTLTATLSNITFEDVIVNLGYTGTAINATDYGVATFITITAGNLTGTTVITATDDAVYEGNETVITDISSVSGGSATENGIQQVTVTIIDDEAAPSVTLSSAPATIIENGGVSTLTATLSVATFEDVTVNLTYSGTATNATDYGVANSITILAGNLTGTTDITGIDDVISEGDETVIADISSVSGGSATENGTQQETVTITDDEGVLVSLSASPLTILENGGTSILTATLDAVTFEDVIVNLGYTGTATNATDYGVATFITITAGSLTGTTVITATDDAVYEGNETVITDITSVSGGNASESGTQQVTVTIDDDLDLPTVTLSASPLTILENGGTSTLTATLSNITFEDVIVNLGYTGTAINATDYGVATFITITAGNLTGTTVITATDDAVYEGNETVITDISSVSGGSATENGIQQVTVTIIDDEAAPSVTLSSAPATIIENGGVSTLTATLSVATFEDVTVNLTYSGTATNAADYGVANSITILAGNLTGTTDITGIDDVISEGDETVIADISSVSGGSATENGTQQETVTITDDEGVLVSLSASPLTILENGGTSILTATLDAVTFEDVIVNLGYIGTATNATDYGVATFITITAGNLTGTTVITATNDAVYEGNETVITDITSVSGGNASESGTQQVTVTIDDDLDLPTVTLSASPLTILENGGTSTLTATLSNITFEDVIVNLGYTGTAINATDYGVATFITITAGNLTGTTVITATDDAVYEGNETVITDISSVSGGSATENGIQQVTVTITDDEAAPSVTLSSAPATIVENGGVSTLTATLSVATFEDVTVNLTYSGTATNATDYGVANSITILAGNLTGTTDITGIDDVISEGDETVIADISSVSGGSATENGTQQETVTITDDEGVLVTLSASPLTILENGGTSTLTATLDAVTFEDVIVNLGYIGTATNATDYGVATFITITAGNLTGTTVITATNDAVYEGNETVITDISSVSGGNASESGTQQVTVTIDDDLDLPTVTLSASPLTILENGGTSTLTATLSNITFEDVIVNLGYTGTAINATDYGVATFITITAGNLTGTTNITATNDAVYEGNETVIADISSVSGGGATENGTQQATVNITDDELAPTVTLSASPTTIAENGVVSTLTATLSGEAFEDVVVTLTYSGTATGTGTDYTAGSATITITAGNTTGTTTVTSVDDLISEGDETVIADITNVNGGDATENGVQSETITIQDDDGVTVTLSSAPATILENGGVSTLTATLSAVTFEDVTINLSYTGTATNATDYGVAASITITAGNLTGTTDITAINDTPYEGNETVIVDISTVTGGNASEDGTQQETVTIDDAADLPTVSLSASPLTIAENGGVSTLTATLSNLTYEDVTVNLAYTGTAINATDYGVANSITITAGNLTGTTNITATNDAVYEGNETVIADISSVSGGGATENGTQQATVNITDDELAPTVTLSASPTTIAENGVVSTLTATLSGEAFEDVVVTLTYSGTATGTGTDYTAGSATITITAGNTTGTTTVTSVDDLISEGDETVIADITNVSGGDATENGVQSETITIQDDDGVTVTLSSAPATILENGGVSTLTATLSAATFEDVTVNLTYTGTATNATDYGVATLITITAGNLTGTTDITAINDTPYEGNETVIVDISTVTGGNASEDGTQQETVTIDDAADLPTVSLSASPLTIAENGGVSTLTATLSNLTYEDVTVNLAYTGTAINATDYGVANSITITAGNLTGTTNITATNDVIYEGSETVITDISTVSGGGATENGTQQATVNITDDELAPTVTLSASPTTIAENGVVSTLTATLSGEAFEDVVVTLTYSGTATGTGTDYTAGSATITITAGNTTGTTTVTSVDDLISEGDETVIADITNVSGGDATENGVQSETITIQDDDGVTVTLSSAPATILENGGVSTLTATLSAATFEDVTVNLTYTGTATNATDYGVATLITITAGNLTGTTDITAINDTPYEGNETVIVDISTVTGGNASEDGTQQETVTIDDAADLPTVSLSASPLTIAENGGVSTLTATLSNLTYEDVTVNLAYTGTAINATDYGVANSITITAGNLTGTTDITATDDVIYEGSETVITDISTVSGGGATENGTQQATVNIDDDVDLPLVTLSANPMTIAENGGVSTLTVTMTNVTYEDVTVNLGYTGTAINATDYNVANSITITAGNLTGITDITATDDAVYEGNETVIVDILSVTGGGAIEDGTQQETVTIEDDDTETDLSIIKTVDNSNPEPGDNIIFTLTVTNSGPSDATDVSVTDQIPSGYTYLSDDGAGNFDSGTGVWTVGNILNTESAVLNITVTVNEIGDYANTANVEGNETDPDETDNSDTNTPTPVFNPSVSLTKTASLPELIEEGAVITYSIVVTNTGNMTLYNIVITDDNADSIEGSPISELLPEESEIITAEHIITLEDINSGEVINTAVATGEDIYGNEVTDESDDPNNLDDIDNNGDGEPDDPTVSEIILSEIKIPEGFSPNGDGINDVFFIRGLENSPENSIIIFNRWGNKVYEASPYNNDWNGTSMFGVTIGGNDLPEGTYFYVLKPSNDEEVIKGYVYLTK